MNIEPDRFLQHYSRVAGLLPGNSNARDQAAAAFRELGLPGAVHGRRPEAWKYTSLRPLAAFGAKPRIATIGQGEALVSGLGIPGAERLVFAGGRFREDLSSAPAEGGSWIFERRDFTALSCPARDPMSVLNTMLAMDGASVQVPRGVDGGTVQLIALGFDQNEYHLRHSISLAPGSRLTLFEISTGEGEYFQNTVAEIRVAEGAHLSHVRLQREGLSAFHVSTIYTDVESGGTYDSFTLSLGAALSRTEIHAQLSGRDAIAHLNASQLLRDSQHGDFTTVVRHKEPGCVSRQTVKNVLTDQAHGVFQGRIEVAREAQKTDGYQMNQTLLLSPGAEINSKPELEIFADDVKCSHGATVGELDADQLFYLQSRGIAESEARSILIHAFVSEALEAVTAAPVREHLDAVVQQWWEHGGND